MADNQLAEDIINEMLGESRRVIPELCKEWQSIGYSQETQRKFGVTVFSHHKALLTEMLSETKDRKVGLVESIDKMTHELSDLSKALNTEIDLDFGNETLLEMAKNLQSSLDELRAVKDSRLSHLKDLADKEMEICGVLGAKPIGLDSTIPSETELANYASYIETRQAEMLRLKTIFENTRMEIINAMDELGYTPKFEFERLVITDHQSFTLTPENMKKLELLHDEIIKKLSAAKENAGKKCAELRGLLEYLDVSMSEFDEFFKQNSGCDPATMANINKEIKKYKDMRMKNIEKYVEKIRDEIRELWELCKLSKRERDNFRAFSCQNYSEDLLTAHELEIKRLKKYWRENAKIFELFYEHQEMLQKMKELDLRADDPNRLNNRGGQLLEEEKERKLLTKNLPKILGKLKELTGEFEEKNGAPFTFDGLTHDEFVQRQMNEFNLEKENLKLAKAKAKDEKKSAKKTPLSASRRNLAISRTMHTSIKRKLPMEKSPVTIGSHKKRLVQSEKTRPTACGSKIRRSGRASRRILGNSFTKTTPVRSKQIPTIKVTDSSSNSTLNLQQYEEFQEHLADRNELRSTLLSEQVLKNIHGNKKMKTPVKTPVKPLRKHLIGNSTPQVTPKSIGQLRPSRSPRITSTPRLTAAPRSGLSNLKL